MDLAEVTGKALNRQAASVGRTLPLDHSSSKFETSNLHRPRQQPRAGHTEQSLHDRLVRIGNARVHLKRTVYEVFPPPVLGIESYLCKDFVVKGGNVQEGDVRCQ